MISAMRFQRIGESLSDQVELLAIGKASPDQIANIPQQKHESSPLQLDRNIDVFQDIARTYPQKTALTSRCGTIDYSTLNVRANRLAWFLHSWGVTRGCVVGVRLPRSIDYVLCMIAIWKAGGAYLPVDCSVPDERVKIMLEDCQADFLLTSQAVSNSYPCSCTPENTFCIDLDKSISTLSEFSSDNLPPMSGPEDLAYIIYTSGSTGRPKGVTITHDSMLNMANEHRQSGEIQEKDRVMVFSPCCFDASIRDINGALLTGATLYVPDEDEILPGNLMDVLRKQCISYVVVTPSVLRNCRAIELPDLSTLVVAGEAADARLIKKWGAGRILINAYGPTETSVCATKRIYVPDHEIDETKPISIGLPTLNTKIYILNESLEPVGPGEIGEIYIGGPGVSRHGYLHRPDLNERAFLSDPFQPGTMFKSGDLGKLWSNGEVQCLGRADSQIKLNGLRIEVEDIENWLRSDERIEDAAVDLRGPSDRRFLAAWAIRTEAGEACDERDLIEDLKALLSTQVPSYSVPSTINFVETWPKSAAGKTVKADLPDPLVESSPDRNGAIEDTNDPAELKLIDILRDLLKIPEDTLISPLRTYYELGGTSLRVQLLMNRINKEFECSIPIGAFYTCGSTIRGIRKLIEASENPLTTSLDREFAEVVSLPHDILPGDAIAHTFKVKEPDHVLLTGATGFLGAHILAELLNLGDRQVTCLVRAKDRASAVQRMRSCLQEWGLWQDIYGSRLRAVPGDVSEPFLGMSPVEFEKLARDCNIVWHCAAAVNFIAPYEISETVNVKGTVEVLRFASTFVPKEVKYVSTLATFFGVGSQIDHATEESTATWGKGIPTGYGQSKWVAEQLALEYQKRGGDLIVLRPGRVLGSLSQKKSPKQDLSICLFRSFLETHTAPDLDWNIDFTPVDICAQLCLNIGASSRNGIYHIINPESIKLAHLITLMNEFGYNIRSIPYVEWKANLEQSEELEPLLSLFKDPMDKAGNSQFEILLNNLCFRNSAYSTSLAQKATTEQSLWTFPKYQDLLNAYIEGSS